MCGERFTQIQSSALNSISDCPMVIFALSGWISSPTTKQRTSNGLWSITENAMDIILSGFWLTNYTATAKPWRKERNIRFIGPALGKPSKDRALTKQAKAQEYQYSCESNEIEGAFGTGKTAYGFARIAAHLDATTFCTIDVALILMNLTKRQRSLLRILSSCLLWVYYQLLYAADSSF